MTLSTTTNRASYSGDGSTIAFAAPFLFLQNSHIEAVLRDVAGAETTWVENTQYTLTGAGNSGGGTLTVKTSPTDYTPASGETLVIRRVVPETQETDYPEGGAFPASAHEDALDKLTMLVQQHSEELARALSSPVSDTLLGDLPLKSDLANNVLGFDFNGDPMAATAIGSAVSAYIATLIDDATAADARTTLGIDGASGNIASGDIAANAITAAKIATGAVGSTEIAPGGVISSAILAGAVDATELATDAVTTVKVADEVFEANRNAIINGNFDIWQRGTSFVNPGNTQYTVDRWLYTLTGAGIVNIQQGTAITPDGTTDNVLEVDVTTADASIASGDIYALNYKVEGYDALRFGFGTAAAREFTLSFWVHSTKTGTQSVVFRNSAGNRAYAAEYTVSAADTWEFKTVTVTADTSGTWLTDSGVGLDISFGLAGGSSYQLAAGSWAASGARVSTNQVNNLDSASNFFRLSRVQLEVGGTATPFERRSFGEVLSSCQRYFAKTFSQSIVPGDNKGSGGSLATIASNDGDLYMTWFFPIVMRTVVPTVTTYNPSIGAAGSWQNANDSTTTPNLTANLNDQAVQLLANPTDATDADDRMQIHLTADAEL